MLLVLFQAAGESFGIEASAVIEVTPAPILRALPHAPAYVAGLVEYRGAAVPVIDVSALCAGERAPRLLSTRLIVVRYGEHMLALLAERVVETTTCVEADLKPMPVRLDGAPWLGPVLMKGGKMIQKITIADLLPPPVRDMLFAEAISANCVEQG